MFTMRRGLLKALGRMVCRVLLGGFGVDVCSGCKGLLMVSGEDELLSNELNELDRSTGVVLNREELREARHATLAAYPGCIAIVG